jgi:hypothetical protein
MFTSMKRLVLAAAVLVAFVAGGAQAQEKALFRALVGAPSMNDSQTSNLANVYSNRAATGVQVLVAEPQALDGTSVLIPLPGAGAVRVDRLSVRTRAAGDFTWQGRVQSTGTQATLVVRGDSIEGSVWVGSEQFVIRPLGDGLHAIGKIDPRAMPPDHPGVPPIAPRSDNQSGDVPSPLEVGQAGVVVDILIAYTPEALAANATIAQMAQAWVDTVNQAYITSNANVELRLAGTYLISGYTEPAATTGADGYGQILSEARAGTMAPMVALRAERDRIGADMVTVLVKHPSYCGLAYVNSSASSAFSVVTHTCGALVLGHELGHNFGSLHDHVTDPQTTPYAYGHGYFYQTQWRTIMSYSGPCNGCPRIPYFSNPSVSYNSVPTGTTTVNDVARLHRERVATVAGFRAVPTATKAVMSSPATNTTLGGSNQAFSWSTGTGVSAYWLYLGTSAGASNLYDSGQTTATSRAVTGLPTNGSTIYARLWSQIAGAWVFNDYTYTASTVTSAAKAIVTSPTPGSTLPGSAATFTWTTGTGVTAYWLYAGTSVGGSNLHDSGQLSSVTRTVTNLPTNGSTVHIRLWSQIAGAWQYSDHSYTAQTGAAAKAVMSSPAQGTTLPGSSTTFNWTATSSAYWLYIGTSPAGSDLHDSGQLSAASHTVGNLPTNGAPVYVRLWSLVGGVWQANDYTYATTVAAALTLPANGATLAGVQTFFWTQAPGAAEYWVQFGQSLNGSNILNVSNGLATTRTITGLNTYPGPGFLRLWTRVGSTWGFRDYQFMLPSAERAEYDSTSRAAR